MRSYTPEALVAVSRYQTFFPTLPKDIQADVYARMDGLIEEEKAFCDKGNYKHMAQILTSIALYEILQRHNRNETEASLLFRKGLSTAASGDASAASIQ